MSDSADKKPSKTRPINRWGVGTLSLLQIVLFVVIFLAVNYLGNVRYKRSDLSRSGDYTLSNVSRRLLASDDFQRRTEPVKLIVACRRSSSFYDRVRSLSEEYARLSNGKVSLELIDPVRSADLTLQLARRYRIDHFTRNLVIVDAREGAPEVPEGEEAENDLASRVRFVDEETMVVYKVGSQRQRRPIGFQGEDAITAALLSAIEGKPRRMYLLADKSDIAAGNENAPWEVLRRNLARRNIELVPTKISELEQIPDDARGLVLLAPRYDLEERELAVLEEYWARPRSALFVALDPAARPARLRSFLRRHGISPRNDRVITRTGGQTNTFVRAAFTPGLEFTQDLWGKSTVIEGASCSLEVRENADDLLNLRISPFKLLEAGGDFWGETKPDEEAPEFDPREDHAAPIAIAAAVIRGAASDDRFAEATSRLVVIGNSGFLNPEGMRPEMLDFLQSSMNWLIGREHLAGIGPRLLTAYKLPLLRPQITFINRINLIILPLLSLVIAVTVWHSRRS